MGLFVSVTYCCGGAEHRLGGIHLTNDPNVILLDYYPQRGGFGTFPFAFDRKTGSLRGRREEETALPEDSFQLKQVVLPGFDVSFKAPNLLEFFIEGGNKLWEAELPQEIMFRDASTPSQSFLGFFVHPLNRVFVSYIDFSNQRRLSTFSAVNGTLLYSSTYFIPENARGYGLPAIFHEKNILSLAYTTGCATKFYYLMNNVTSNWTMEYIGPLDGQYLLPLADTRINTIYYLDQKNTKLSWYDYEEHASVSFDWTPNDLVLLVDAIRNSSSNLTPSMVFVALSSLVLKLFMTRWN